MPTKKLLPTWKEFDHPWYNMWAIESRSGFGCSRRQAESTRYRRTPSRVYCDGPLPPGGGRRISSPFPLAPYTLLSPDSIFLRCHLLRRSGLCDRRKPGTCRNPHQKFPEMIFFRNLERVFCAYSPVLAPPQATARQRPLEAAEPTQHVQIGKHPWALANGAHSAPGASGFAPLPHRRP